MKRQNRVWPSGDAYQNAVLSPKRFLKDVRLHSTQVESRFFLGSQRPHLRSGNFGAVYKLRNRARAYALKVFYKADPDRQLRYQLIHQHLQRFPKSPNLVSFQYDDQGILVHGHWYPTLVMDWVHGVPLDLYMQQHLDSLNNGQLCLGWVNLVEGLQSRQVAHGDLQHGNILVLPNGHFYLVDYDGMFVPAMRVRGLQAAECGLPAYQHPGRTQNRRLLHERLDDFAALVILLTLACASQDRWKDYHTDDNCLLFSKADLVRPRESRLFAELCQSPDAPIQRLACLLRSAACGPLEAVTPFRQVVADAALKPLWSSHWRPSPRPKPVSVLAPQAVKPVQTRIVLPSWVEQARKLGLEAAPSLVLKSPNKGPITPPTMPKLPPAVPKVPIALAEPQAAGVRELPAAALYPEALSKMPGRSWNPWWLLGVSSLLLLVLGGWLMPSQTEHAPVLHKALESGPTDLIDTTTQPDPWAKSHDT